jgi:hypothetical protein
MIIIKDTRASDGAALADMIRAAGETIRRAEDEKIGQTAGAGYMTIILSLSATGAIIKH